ncbi:low affinity immunoglobulin epsilon Fc receptor-like [Cebidichthys violaceus]|uniref:low affinity immunoglobulin epsilon Fc receptor-like n=1 Tax=Cebidichthys violaceus TaxID=271503 RepID=UPI0035CB54E9
MDSMEIDDSFYINKNLLKEGLVTKVDFQRRKQPSRCVTVCLGLLCAVLLAGNIGQFIYYEIISQFQGVRLQDSYDASAAERKQLEAKLSNLTEEKGQLQQSYTALTTERDEFRASFNNLTNENNQLQASYNTIKRESDQLQTSFNNMQKSHNNLTSTKDQLQTNYRNLQREKDEFQTLSITLRANRDQLQSNYSSLKKNKDQLQISYNTMSTSKDDLQIRYNSLTNDKDRLQSSYNSQQNEKEQLQNKYNSLVKVKDELEKKINKVRAGRPCQRGWSKFEMSCYFVSTKRKNWTLSREDCIAEGADLVIIDSRDEQVFVNGLMTLRLNVWIGMTDSVTEGTWTWVDGTPVTTTYWEAGQPNSHKGGQDCGEIMQRSSGVETWNDETCSYVQKYICEQ